MNKEQIRLNMKRMRRAKRITQEKMAEICGVSPWLMAAIERGKREVDRETLERFCLALDWPLEELLWKAE